MVLVDNQQRILEEMETDMVAEEAVAVIFPR